MLTSISLSRRILWLIDQWTGAKPITGILATVYDFVISSLDRRFDMAVRLTASAALRQVLDDFEFDSSKFEKIFCSTCKFFVCFLIIVY